MGVFMLVAGQFLLGAWLADREARTFYKYLCQERVDVSSGDDTDKEGY